MNDSTDMSGTIFVARRVTPALLEDLMPGAVSSSDHVNGLPSNMITRIYEAAASAGVSVSNALSGLLSLGGNRAIKSYAVDKARGGQTNLFGSYLICMDANKITVVDGKGFLAPPKNGDLFVVADFVGLPIARLSGSIGASAFSVLSHNGQSTLGEYAIDLWVDAGTDDLRVSADRTSLLEMERRVGSFLKAFMQDRDDLDLDQFLNISVKKLQPLIGAMTDVPPPLSSWDQTLPSPSTDLDRAIQNFQEGASRLLGLSAFVRFRPGKKVFRHSLTVDSETAHVSQQFSSDNFSTVDMEAGHWACGACSTLNSLENSFCLECGNSKPSAVRYSSSVNRQLLSIDGDELIFDLSFESYEQSQVDLDAIASRCFEILRPLCRQENFQSAQLPVTLTHLSTALNGAFTTNQYGPVGGFGVVDFRTIDTDWHLQTRANKNDKARWLNRRFSEMELDDREMAVIEAERLSRKKRLDQERLDNELAIEGERSNFEFEANKQRVELEFERTLEENKLDDYSQLNRARARTTIENATVDRAVRQNLTSINREDIVDEREDQLSQVDHDMNLEKKVQEHDLELNRRRLENDADLEERLARLRANRNVDIARMEQELDLEKLKSVSDMETSKKITDTELEIQKLRAMSEMELAQRDQLKGLTPSQILALQATKLAENGAGDALKELASHNAAAAQALIEARTNEARAELLQEMLKIQASANSEANDRQLAIMKQALDAQLSASQRVEQAHNKTAESAEKWNERSIDTIGKIAAVKAGQKNTDSASQDSVSGSTTSCSKCGVVSDKGHKFCPSCGQPCNSGSAN